MQLRIYSQSSFGLALVMAVAAIYSPVPYSGSTAHAQQAVKLTDEAQLIQIISSGSDNAEKAMACKRLAVFGSEACIPEVAKLLSDKQLASWARITLEAIPGEPSKAALREAASNLDGLLAVGVINSIGNLRDGSAVDLLAKKLAEAAPEVASAAAFALGRIGNAASAAALRSNLAHAVPEVQDAVAESCIYAADHLAKAGETALATELYDAVRAGQFKQQRIVEATRGSILVRGEAGVAVLVEHLSSDNPKLFNVALQTARELASDSLSPALIDHLPSASADRAPLIVQTLAELKGKPDLAALQSLAAKGSKEVRAAAVEVLGRVGDVSCVAPLLAVAKQNADLAASVRAALVALGDEKVDADLLQRIGQGDNLLILIEAIGLRQLEATEQLVRAVDSSDDAIRAAALQSLGQTVPQSKLDTLVALALNPKRATDTENAYRALKTAAIRMPDREACAATLSTALKSASPKSKGPLLEIIAAVGGSNALATVREYAAGSDMPLRDVGTRLLGEWMTIDVADVLLDLHLQGPRDQYQDRAMRGYVRVARQFAMPEGTRIEMCKTIFDKAKLREQKLVFDIVKKFPSPAMLQLALDALNKPELAEDAKATIVAIKPKLANNAEAKALLEKAGF